MNTALGVGAASAQVAISALTIMYTYQSITNPHLVAHLGVEYTAALYLIVSMLSMGKFAAASKIAPFIIFCLSLLVISVYTSMSEPDGTARTINLYTSIGMGAIILGALLFVFFKSDSYKKWEVEKQTREKQKSGYVRRSLVPPARGDGDAVPFVYSD